MIKGFRFTNQLANAEVDARIHQEFLNRNDGIFYGMDLNKTTNSITISEGMCEIAGRPVAVIDNETVAVSTDNLYCLLVLEVDLSKESTKDIFNQVSFKVLTSVSSYPNVTKQDINKYNGTNNIYQLEFARFRTGVNGISEFKDTRTFLNFTGIYTQIKNDCEEIINQIKQELEKVKDESVYKFKEEFSKVNGSFTINASTSGIERINYPAGFTKENCVVVSCGIEVSEAKGYNYIGQYVDSSDGLNNSFTRRVNLTNENIVLSVRNPNTSNMTVKYKIVLMKI